LGDETEDKIPYDDPLRRHISLGTILILLTLSCKGFWSFCWKSNLDTSAVTNPQDETLAGSAEPFRAALSESKG